MRILRIALRNFRGVDFREVHIPPAGVTVIEGPNEIGKSSLAEAINLLFDYPDGSTDKAVKAVQRVDADLGAEVEVELTVGGYHVIYWKRWHRQPGTTLRVVAPSPEQHSGRRAHERMREILEESIDLALWKALRYEQGIGITQARVGKSRSLAQALDDAAGKGLGDEGEAEDVWSRVEAERALFFTPTGRPTGDRADLTRKVERAAEEVERLTRELTELDAAAEDHRRLRQELAEMSSRLASQERAVREREDEWNRLQAEQQELDRFSVEAARSAGLAERAAAAHRKRLDSIEQLRLAEQARVELAELADPAARALEAAARALTEARGHREDARRAQRTAEQTEALARGDLDYFRDVFNLEMLLERRGRARAAEKRQREARAFLDGCPLDATRLEEIQKAHLDVATARARLTAESASVRVEALAPTELEVGGAPRSLAAGEVVETPVAGSVQIILPGRVRMTVTGGTRTRELQDDTARAEEHLQTLYAAVGVSGNDPLAQARELERRRRAAEQTADQATKTLQENLRDLTPQGLEDLIERTRARTDGYPTGRPSRPVMPAGREEAQTANDRAAAELASAREAAEARHLELKSAEDALDHLTRAALAREIEIRVAADTVKALEKGLAAERETVGDEQLAADLADVHLAAEEAAAAYRAAADRLKGRNPEQVRTLLENARVVLTQMKDGRGQAELRLEAVKTELRLKGEAGLHDRLDTAETERLRWERQKAHTDRRAAAAELLHTTLGKHRDAAKRAYVAPFREQLEGFGRIVFGADLRIDVDHETLEINSRTLDGVTVPYRSLSIGAQEQLSLIARLACAVLASRPGVPDGGVPVIIDDALGNSDPARLERLGAVLGLAGRRVQVIVLTCTPDRYRNVGSATVIRLPAVGSGGEELTPALFPAEGPVTLPPGNQPGTDDDSSAARVIRCLAEAELPLGRSAIIARSGLPEGSWAATIASLMAQGRVVREGAKRGVRYRLP